MNIEWKILMNNFKIPKIRFMNFNDKWNYKTLDEISNSIEYGLNASAKNFDGIHKYLRITDIDDSSRLFLTDKLSSPDVNFTEEDYENYKLQKNNLLFARTGASVGKTYLYRESDGEVYYAGFLIRARLHDSYDGNFVFQQTLTDKYKRFIEITSQRSGQPGVNGKEYGEWKIGMTSYPEQSAIGSLFRTLDDLLTSYKDNLANYQSLKSTMLSKMFPKAGKTVPEIRLDGFEGEWENLRLGDCAIIKGRLGWKSLKQEEYTEVGPSMIASKHIKNGVIDWGEVDHIPQWRYDESPEIMLEKGDIIFSKDGSLGNPALVSNLKGEATINSTMMLVRLDKKVSSQFFYQVLTSSVFQKLIYLKVSGSSIPHLFQADMQDFRFFAPCIEEQQAIGAYFSNLDNLIVAHQDKISQLETLKKKLLQDMFI